MPDTHDQTEFEEKREISLYEFYVLGIDRLLLKAPWELDRVVSAYHETFLTEQRCLGLTILLLMGEDHVPIKTLNALPGFEHQARISTNQAVFMRALKVYFERKHSDASRAEKVLARMVPYINDARSSSAANDDPLERMLASISKRIPPKDDKQKQLYKERIDKMFDYIEKLVTGDLLVRYQVTSQ